MTSLKNALTAILILTSFSVHCSSSNGNPNNNDDDDDDKASSATVAATTLQDNQKNPFTMQFPDDLSAEGRDLLRKLAYACQGNCRDFANSSRSMPLQDNQKETFLEQLPDDLSAEGKASLRQLVYAYQGNFRHFANASRFLFLYSGARSQYDIVPCLNALAKKNNPLFFARSCAHLLENHFNIDCRAFVINTVSQHDNAGDTAEVFSKDCLDLIGKSMSVGSEFAQNLFVERVEKVAACLKLSTEKTKLAIGYSDLETAQLDVEETKCAADDAKRAAVDARRQADDAKREVDDAKEAKSAAEKAMRAAEKAMRAANITESGLKKAQSDAERSAKIAESDSESDSEDAEENSVKKAMRAAKKAESAVIMAVRKTSRAEHIAELAKRKADDAERSANIAESDAEAKKQDVKSKINSLLLIDLTDKIKPSHRKKFLEFFDKKFADKKSADISDGSDDEPVSFVEFLADLSCDSYTEFLFDDSMDVENVFSAINALSDPDHRAQFERTCRVVDLIGMNQQCCEFTKLSLAGDPKYCVNYYNARRILLSRDPIN